jgi:hypothetical protein
MATHDVNGNATPNQRMGANNSPRTETTPEAATRDARIVELRRHRIAWQDIAKDVGSTREYVRKRYERIMAKIPQQHVDEHRAEELILIDDAVCDLLTIARDERGENVSHRSRIEAWSTIRAWAERKAKLLGLDAPQQTITVDLVDDEIKKLTQEIEKLSVAQGEGHPG